MTENRTRICGLLPDFEIKRLAIEQIMIAPFVDHQVRVDERSGEPVISYGCSPTGYDIRLGTHFREPVKIEGITFIDPKRSHEIQWKSFEIERAVFIDPGNFILGESIEMFKMPVDVMAICTGKSKLARAGIFVNVTPLEVGWTGKLTLEIANLGQIPVLVYPNEGIGQLLFYRVEERPVRVYQGTYQNQQGIELPKL